MRINPPFFHSWKTQRRFQRKARRSTLPPTPIHLSHRNQKRMRATSSPGRDDFLSCQRGGYAIPIQEQHMCVPNTPSVHTFTAGKGPSRKGTHHDHIIIGWDELKLNLWFHFHTLIWWCEDVIPLCEPETFLFLRLCPVFLSVWHSASFRQPINDILSWRFAFQMCLSRACQFAYVAACLCAFSLHSRFAAHFAFEFVLHFALEFALAVCFPVCSPVCFLVCCLVCFLICCLVCSLACCLVYSLTNSSANFPVCFPVCFPLCFPARSPAEPSTFFPNYS